MASRGWNPENRWRDLESRNIFLCKGNFPSSIGRKDVGFVTRVTRMPRRLLSGGLPCHLEWEGGQLLRVTMKGVHVWDRSASGLTLLLGTTNGIA